MISSSSIMNIVETVRVAFDALSANKLRSSLTMLGVVIGVASVILLVSIGEGAKNYISDQFCSPWDKPEEIKGKQVDFYWWLKTPGMKLTEPVLRTKECCQEHAGEIFNIKPATQISSTLQSEDSGESKLFTDKLLVGRFFCDIG